MRRRCSSEIRCGSHVDTSEAGRDLRSGRVLLSQRPVSSFGVILNHRRWPGAQVWSGIRRSRSESRSRAPVISRPNPCTTTLHPCRRARSISSTSKATLGLAVYDHR
jgi:hypothetical protein